MEGILHHEKLHQILYDDDEDYDHDDDIRLDQRESSFAEARPDTSRKPQITRVGAKYVLNFNILIYEFGNSTVHRCITRNFKEHFDKAWITFIQVSNDVVARVYSHFRPPLHSLHISTTIRRTLVALKSSDDTNISMWTTTDHSRCIGQICMVDIICYLWKQENISSHSIVLNSQVSDSLSHLPGVVKHVGPSYTLVDAIDLIINGVQNLVIPIKNTSKRKQLWQLLSIPPATYAGGREFCWLTQEDVMRFILSSIGLFSPTTAYSIE
ncbi:hypothetical protein R6Q59_018956 [Mikania micrantha]